MALWRVVDDDDVILSSPVAGYQSYSHWTAGLHNPSDDDNDDDDDLMTTSGSGPATRRPLATTPRSTGSRRHDRPLHVPLYYRMKPVSVKPCEKAEKVRAFAYNDIRQVIIALLLSLSSLSSSE